MRVRACNPIRTDERSTEFDSPPAEVLGELLQLLGRRLTIFFDGPVRAPTRDEPLVVVDHLRGVCRGVPTGGVEIVVARQLRCDVDGQAVAYRVREEYPTEVVRRERDW